MSPDYQKGFADGYDKGFERGVDMAMKQLERAIRDAREDPYTRIPDPDGIRHMGFASSKK